MPIPAAIAELVECFARNQSDYTAPDYKEARLRQEFLDPFFIALGWDVTNTQGYAEADKEVVIEDAIRAGTETKAPDYCFRVGGTRKNFRRGQEPCRQPEGRRRPRAPAPPLLVDQKLPLGILTDFQEVAIYDTRIRARAPDKAHVGRIFYCRFEDYADKWDEIAAILSKESVLRGSFDRHAASVRGKRGTQQFDEAFLATSRAGETCSSAISRSATPAFRNATSISSSSVSLTASFFSASPRRAASSPSASCSRCSTRRLVAAICWRRTRRATVAGPRAARGRSTRDSSSCLTGPTSVTTPAFFTFAPKRAATSRPTASRPTLTWATTPC